MLWLCYRPKHARFFFAVARFSVQEGKSASSSTPVYRCITPDGVTLYTRLSERESGYVCLAVGIKPTEVQSVGNVPMNEGEDQASPAFERVAAAWNRLQDMVFRRLTFVGFEKVLVVGGIMMACSALLYFLLY